MNTIPIHKSDDTEPGLGNSNVEREEAPIADNAAIAGPPHRKPAAEESIPGPHRPADQAAGGARRLGA
ncbi:MAG: hypothetical protein FJ399_07010 [Verrucomicrobia bacterium]|nr:hypothetical protein [Verrucomicrobiota bacterium]